MVCAFVLIDSRHKPQPIDMEFMQWLGEHGIPFCIIFTKADKLKEKELDKNLENYKSEMLVGGDPGHDGGLPPGGGGGGNGDTPPASPSNPGPNHDSIDGTDIMTAPIMRLNTIGKLQDLLELSSFDSPKMEWLRKSASADQIFDLYNFIQEEQESEEAKAFAKEAIDAFMNGGEVDFEEQISVFPKG